MMGKLRVKIALVRLVVAVPRLRKTDRQEILFYCPDLNTTLGYSSGQQKNKKN